MSYKNHRTITNKLEIQEFKQKFAGKSQISFADFRSYYIEHEPGIPEATIRWRVYDLSRKGIIQRIGHGIYRLGQGIIFTPSISIRARKIYNSVKKTFPYATTCIWHTSILNEFMIHQPAKFNLLVEVEKEAVEPVYYFFKGKHEGVFMNPDERMYRDYIAGERESIIVKTLISEAPVRKVDNISVPTLEKILVDIYCDTVIFSSFAGKEMQNIYKYSFEKYSINFSAFYRYADRRNKKEEIHKYIKRLNLAPGINNIF